MHVHNLDMKWPGAAETARTVRQQEVSPVSSFDFTTQTQTEQDNLPSWMHIPISRAVVILEDMSGGQLYHFEFPYFKYSPEPALELMWAAKTASEAAHAGTITLSKDAEWAIGMIADARATLEAMHPIIPSYIDDGIDSDRCKTLLDEFGSLRETPSDYIVDEVAPRKPANRNRPGYVYVLRSSTGAYKIGLARNPQNRLETFTVKLPFEVEYDTLIKTDDMRRLEAELHAHYAHKRINGEWFALDAADLEELRAMGGAE
jgi:hypothetical protein